MRRIISALAATAALTAITTLGVLSSSPAGARDHDDYNGAYNCVNPAGHMRGRCRNNGARNASVAGRVISVGGVLAQFATNNRGVITLNEQPLLAMGAPLIPGRYYSLRGYWTNGLFYATAIRSWAY